VLLIRGKARRHRVGPSDPLKAGRDLGVVQVRVVTALAADELKRAGVAAFQLALLDAGRLAPQAGRIAVAQLASNRECDGTLVVDAQPQVTGIVRSTARAAPERDPNDQPSQCRFRRTGLHQSLNPQGQRFIPLPGSGAAPNRVSQHVSSTANAPMSRRLNSRQGLGRQQVTKNKV